MGNESIDLSLKNIWRSWFEFRKGKRTGAELHTFQYSLEKNLHELHKELNEGQYHHGGYRKFTVCDNKRREISVASVRDRVVHRLIYDYLEKIYDKTFIYDAWSCRKEKGLLGAIERAQSFLDNYAGFARNTHTHTHTHTPRSHFPWIWKCDVRKFFDSVDQEVLLTILSRRVKDNTTLSLLKEVVDSFSTVAGRKVGMPIGNLTSQIFANIYMNELDRFVKHNLKVGAYLRYGDDFIVIENDPEELKNARGVAVSFLFNELKLQVNPKSDRIMKVSHGLKFLGVKLWLFGRTLNRRNQMRIKERLDSSNISSYSGILKKHGNQKKIKEFNWLVFDKIINK